MIFMVNLYSKFSDSEHKSPECNHNMV